MSEATFDGASIYKTISITVTEPTSVGKIITLTGTSPRVALTMQSTSSTGSSVLDGLTFGIVKNMPKLSGSVFSHLQDVYATIGSGGTVADLLSNDSSKTHVGYAFCPGATVGSSATVMNIIFNGK